MGHEFCCSVIYQNVDFFETKRLGTSDCTRTQFADVAEQMYVKIGGVTGLRGVQLPTNYGSPKVVTSCTILRNYIDILNPLPVNIGVYITRSANLVPLIVLQGPNDSGIAGYGHTPSKIIISLPICGGDFLYLLPCSTVLSCLCL